MDTNILIKTKWWNNFNYELYIKYLEAKYQQEQLECWIDRCSADQ